MCNSSSNVRSGLAYVWAFVLTRAGRMTHNALRKRLETGHFDKDSRFTVWVIPKELQVAEGFGMVPLEDVPYDQLRHLLPRGQWDSVESRLVAHYYSSTGELYPFWINSPEQDDKYRLIRCDESLGTMSEVCST